MKLTSNFLSNLRINTDKNWNSWNIYNLGRGRINLGSNQELSPALYLDDIGKKWISSGYIPSPQSPFTSEYCCGGIVLIGAGDAVFRSIDYGATWTDLGTIVTLDTSVGCIKYCGNGLVILGGANDTHIYRSTDYGKTWTDLGAVVGEAVFSLSYFGNGRILAGTYEHHMYKSTDYGETWNDLGEVCSSVVRDICYCGNGVALFTTDDNHIFRSTDYGETWTDLGDFSTRLHNIAYCGNGILLCGGENKHIFRSVDYGLSWSDIGVVTSGYVRSMCYCTNGIVLVGDGNGRIFRSSDYGISWTDLGDVGLNPTSVRVLSYCTNGVVTAADYSGNVIRSDCSFKSNENFQGDGNGGDVVNPVMFMDFWSDNLAYIELSNNNELPDIFIDDLPDNVVIIKAIMILKYGQKENYADGYNFILSGDIVCKEEIDGEYVPAITFQSLEAFSSPESKEGGDVHIGYYNISYRDSNIFGNCTVKSRLDAVDTEYSEDLYLYDVQLGIRIYFRFAE